MGQLKPIAVVSALLAITGTASSTTPAAAQSAKGQFGISPARRTVVARPPINLVPTQVFNDTREAFDVRVFPVLLSQELDGSFGFPETPKELRQASLILNPVPVSFSLPSGAERNVRLRWQQFPTGTKVGAIGVVFEGTPVKVQTGAVRNITRLLSINLLSLPGRFASSGEFTRLRPEQIEKSLYLTARVKNTGEKIDKPRGGEMLIRRDSDDAVVFRRRWVGDIVMPDAQRDFPIEITKILPAGEYTGKVTMAFGSTRRARIITPFRLTGPNQLPTAAFSIRDFNGKGEIDGPALVTGLIDSTGTAPFKSRMAISLFATGVGASTTEPIARKTVELDIQASRDTKLETEMGTLQEGTYRVEGLYKDAAGDPQSVTASFSTTKPQSFFDKNGTLLIILAIVLVLLLLAAFLASRFRRLRREVASARSGTAAAEPAASGPAAVEGPAQEAPTGSAIASGRIDINTASAAQLQTLPGVGPKAAERIIEHREEFGRFESVDDLSAIENFGAKRIDGLRDRASAGEG